MPTAAINLILAETRILSGDTLHAQVVIDSADPDTVVHELYAEIRGIGRSGWVNIHTDKIYETEKVCQCFEHFFSANFAGIHECCCQFMPFNYAIENWSTSIWISNCYS